MSLPWRILVSLYLFVMFLDSLGFARAIYRGRLAALSNLRESRAEIFEFFDKWKVEIKPEHFVKIDWTKCIMFLLFSITPGLNMIYAYIMLAYPNIIDSVFTGAMMKASDNLLKKFCLKILEDSNIVDENADNGKEE